MTDKVLRIVVGVTGGIAAFKAVGVIRAFVKDGHHVDVVATAAALEFVGRPTLEAMSRNPVHVGLYDDVAQVRHVALGQQADVIVIAPATANTLANIAHGMASDLLGNTVLARRGPLIVAPAMHTEMWTNPATASNIETLRSRGVLVVGPGTGALTGDDSGEGRMSEVEEIVDAVYAAVSTEDRPLEGKRVLISAGGTREPLDPVRFLGNRSSGAMGVALAQEAQRLGARVTLVAAHIEVDVPAGVEVHAVSTALHLSNEMMALSRNADVVIMAAAVADFRPEHMSPEKLKKSDLGESTSISLVQNPDVLAALGAQPRTFTLVGFAAETASTDEALIELATAKLHTKKCDFVVANRVGDDIGFGEAKTTVNVINATGRIIESATGTKASVARAILKAIS